MVARYIRVLILGVTLIVALSSFVSPGVAAAAAYPSFGPQTYDVHKYYYFGDATYGEKTRQGIDVSVDPASVSYQSVKATVTMDYNIIDDRKITKFIVLANGVNVDEFEPYFDTSLQPPVYKEYYYLDVNVSDQYIGSDVYFQVVGLHEEKNFNNSKNVFVVAWSQETPTVRLKPLPVTDNDTHDLISTSNGLLADILAKLDDLKMMLSAKLDQLTKAVEDIYTVKPQTQAKFDAALQNFQNNLPTEQMKNEMDKVKDMLDDSADKINNTPSELQFGQINWMGKVTTAAVDFTQVEKQVELLRRIMQITLWAEFFYCIILILRPRFTV